MNFPTPDNEQARLAALAAYNVYGTDPEPDFDDLAELAAQIGNTPIALVNIVGDDKTWLKSTKGTPPGLDEVPRGALCCAYTLCQTDIFCVEDLHTDERFKDLPFIGTDPFVRFYVGIPLIDSQGYALGTLCLMALEPRELDHEIAEGLRRLGRQVVSQLELRIKLEAKRVAEESLLAEKERSDQLIHNILPAAIAKELTETGSVQPRFHQSVTIGFTDFVGFTKRAEKLAPRALVDELNVFFTKMDEIAARQDIEKIKTIGDSYMCAAGLGGTEKDHPVRACLAALEMQDFCKRQNTQREKIDQLPWDMRIGIHTGPAMSGIVGKHKFSYDIWGDSVNIAARMETSCEPGGVNISENTYQMVKNYFECVPRGSVEMKSKGAVPMYFVSGLKPEYAADGSGWRPSEKLQIAISGVTPGWVI